MIFLKDHDASFNDIRLTTGLGKRDIEIYLELYTRFNDHSHREHLDRLSRRYELEGDGAPQEVESSKTFRFKKANTNAKSRTFMTVIRQTLQEVLGVTSRVSLMAAMDIISYIEKAYPRASILTPGQVVVMTDQILDMNQFIKLFGDKMLDTQPAMEVRA